MLPMPELEPVPLMLSLADFLPGRRPNRLATLERTLFFITCVFVPGAGASGFKASVAASIADTLSLTTSGS